MADPNEVGEGKEFKLRGAAPRLAIVAGAGAGVKQPQHVDLDMKVRLGVPYKPTPNALRVESI